MASIPGVAESTAPLVGAAQSELDIRNFLLRNILGQLDESQLGLLAAGPADELARGLRDRRIAARADLVRRGLSNSGAAPTAERGLLRAFGRGTAKASVGARGAEEKRRDVLLTALLGVPARDLARLQELGQGQLAAEAGHGQQRIESAKDQAAFMKSMVEMGKLAATAVAAGAGAGAFGGGIGGGGLMGALQGAGLAQAALSGNPSALTQAIPGLSGGFGGTPAPSPIENLLGMSIEPDQRQQSALSALVLGGVQ